jgi:hypothetical protein
MVSSDETLDKPSRMISEGVLGTAHWPIRLKTNLLIDNNGLTNFNWQTNLLTDLIDQLTDWLVDITDQLTYRLT